VWVRALVYQSNFDAMAKPTAVGFKMNLNAERLSWILISPVSKLMKNTGVPVPENALKNHFFVMGTMIVAITQTKPTAKVSPTITLRNPKR